MMFVIRSGGEWPDRPDIEVKLSRETPASVPDAAGNTDFFCLGDPEVMPALRTRMRCAVSRPRERRRTRR